MTEPKSWNDALDKDDLTTAYMVGYHKRDDEVRALKAENERLREALTPSADTKAAYMGEFNMGIQMSLPGGDTDYRSVQIPWTAIKEIMAAIRARAALNPGKDRGEAP